MVDTIKIIGARQHNLKNLTVEIPKGKFTVITGLSGSGKSSLVFDTLYAEGQRRYVESLSTYARQFLGSLERPDVDRIEGLSPAISIDQKTASSNPRSTVGTMTEIYDYLRLLYARIGQPHCPKCGRKLRRFSRDRLIKELEKIVKNSRKKLKLLVDISDLTDLPRKTKELYYHNRKYTRRELENRKLNGPVSALVADLGPETDLDRAVSRALSMGSVIRLDDKLFSLNYFCPRGHFVLEELSPRIFSFNSPFGACPKCYGLGTRKVIDPQKLIPSPGLTLAQGAIRPWGRRMAGSSDLLKKVSQLGIAIDRPFNQLTEKEKKIVLYGDPKNDYKGAIADLEERYLTTDSDHVRAQIEKYMKEKICSVCRGQRLKPGSRNVLIKNRSIGQLAELDLEKISSFLAGLKLSSEEEALAGRLIKDIKKRLNFLRKVGVGYLTLNRSAQSLAGGEAQRVRLASQLGSALGGVIYILDEPTIGLHSSDVDSLLGILKELKNYHSTVVVVEHDRQTIESADYLIDMGPGAGVNGGRIIAQGVPAQLKKAAKSSLTIQYLTGRKEIAVPFRRREGNGKALEIIGASQFNLKNIDVKIPLGRLVSFAGVSGSGKSTLVYEILGKALAKRFYQNQAEPGKCREIRGIDYLDKVINIDQAPIGRTPRSNPATYTNIFNLVRKEFAKTKLARQRGYDASRFSFNVPKGRCEHCAGQGFNKVEMYFLDDIYVTCPKCKGARYNKQTLEIEYQGRNIAQVLSLTVDEAREFFRNSPKIRRKLEVLQDVGLGYLELGQPATTLSGGEAQRVKLAKELSRKSLNQTLYILDEPTTGLHFEDIRKLLDILGKLVDRGNTVLVIEHNLDVLKTADWIIDLGPGGGDKGGRIVAQGTPEEIAQSKHSLTGRYLKPVLRF